MNQALVLLIAYFTANDGSFNILLNGNWPFLQTPPFALRALPVAAERVCGTQHPDPKECPKLHSERHPAPIMYALPLTPGPRFVRRL